MIKLSTNVQHLEWWEELAHAIGCKVYACHRRDRASFLILVNGETYLQEISEPFALALRKRLCLDDKKPIISFKNCYQPPCVGDTGGDW